MKRNKLSLNDNGAYQKFCDNSYSAFVGLLKDTTALKKVEIEQFNKYLQVMPDIVGYDTSKLKVIADALDPFDRKTKTFDLYIPKIKPLGKNWNNAITHNSGYFQMANLYILTNQFQKFNNSFDSILFYNKNFLNTTYGYSFDRFFCDLIITNKLFSKEGLGLIAKIEEKKTVKSNFPVEVIMLNNLLFDKSDVTLWTIKRFAIKGNHNACDLQMQWERISYKQLNDLAENIISKFLANPKQSNDEKNYMAALLYKAKAFTNNKKENYSTDLIKENLRNAMSYYKKVGPDYLKSDITIGEGDLRTVGRAKLFKHPFIVSLTDSYNPFEIWDWRVASYRNKSVFLDYVFTNENLMDFYFKNDVDAEILNDFLLSYYSTFRYKDKDEKTFDLTLFLKAIDTENVSSKFDKDAFLAFCTSYYHSRNNVGEATRYEKMINKKKLFDKEKLSNPSYSYKYYNLAKVLLNYFLKNHLN
ncbi:MAG: hypothetical protein IPH89_14690 [Bacteroidetes bacterium]|nr:hypothetical protein [Bacteroidota bacterium]